MGLVIIPYDYDPMNDHTGIVPICIENIDRYGDPIHPGWFQAMVPIAEPMRRLARSVIRDVWRTSELAQESLHAQWYRHRDDLGRNPSSRIYAHAKWKARDLRDGSRNARRGIEVELLESIRSKLRAVEDVHSELELRDIIKRLEGHYDAHGAEHVSDMMHMWLHGCQWDEIACHVGKKKKAASKDFWRWFRRALRELNLV